MALKAVAYSQPTLQQLGPVSFNYGSTTAVKLGTTPGNGRFIPLIVVASIDSSATPAGISSATIGVGVSSPNYNETLFTFLDSSFDAVNEFYRWNLPGSATAVADYAPSTDVYAKMGTAISGGTLTGKISIIGISGF